MFSTRVERLTSLFVMVQHLGVARSMLLAARPNWYYMNITICFVQIIPYKSKTKKLLTKLVEVKCTDVASSPPYCRMIRIYASWTSYKNNDRQIRITQILINDTKLRKFNTELASVRNEYAHNTVLRFNV